MDIQANLAVRFDALQGSMDKVASAVDEQGQYWLSYFRGIKWIRLPLTLQGKVSAAAINLGESSGQILGPEQGYAWSLMRLCVDGLGVGATPDIVQLFRTNNTGQAPLWTFSGNTQAGLPGPQALFPRLGLVLMPGDTLNLVNSGALTATGVIRLSGELIEVPAEMLPKLA